MTEANATAIPYAAQLTLFRIAEALTTLEARIHAAYPSGINMDAMNLSAGSSPEIDELVGMSINQGRGHQLDQLQYMHGDLRNLPEWLDETLRGRVARVISEADALYGAYSSHMAAILPGADLPWLSE